MKRLTLHRIASSHRFIASSLLLPSFAQQQPRLLNIFAYFCSVFFCSSCSAWFSGHITFSRTASSSLSDEDVQF
jgi:hypothetical protein